jgi:hypothetical protein
MASLSFQFSRGFLLIQSWSYFFEFRLVGEKSFIASIAAD